MQEMRLTQLVVLCIDVENEAEHIVTDEFKLLDEDFESSVSATFNNHSIYTGLDIKLSVPGLDHNLAYIFHSWCYDILYWKQHNSSTINNPTTIYNLAKSLSHEASPWETIGTNADGWLDPPSRIETLIGDLNDDESAKWQPGFLSRLPAEIRAPIWGYVGMRSAYSSFFLVSRETSKLVGKVRMSGKRSLRIERGDVVRSGVTRFFGSDYVNVLENFGGGARDYKDVLIEEEVKSINVIAGLPGICALQFKGEDWESKWLGTVPNGGQVWYGTLENPGLAIDTIFTVSSAARSFDNGINFIAGFDMSRHQAQRKHTSTTDVGSARLPTPSHRNSYTTRGGDVPTMANADSNEIRVHAVFTTVSWQGSCHRTYILL
jgi:hypothetical protein